MDVQGRWGLGGGGAAGPVQAQRKPPCGPWGCAAWGCRCTDSVGPWISHTTGPDPHPSPLSFVMRSDSSCSYTSLWTRWARPQSLQRCKVPSPRGRTAVRSPDWSIPVGDAERPGVQYGGC